MKWIVVLMLGGLIGFQTATAAGPAADPQAPEFTRLEDVVYGRKDGMALTMDVLTPKNPTGAAVIWVVSGGWISSHDNIHPGFFTELLNRGYTIFAVVHGSQPRYSIPDAVADLNRAVRFIRCHAKDYKIDPNRLGISGASAGGHLSLMQGTAGSPGKADAKDPLEATSSRVQAVACFFPPTDFLSFGLNGKNKELTEKMRQGLGAVFDYRQFIPKKMRAPFDFREYAADDNEFKRITDKKKILKLFTDISPATHVSADDPPTLIMHGDADQLVPLQQAELMTAKFKEVSVPVKLIVKKGEGHGWKKMDKDLAIFADWFDQYLKAQGTAEK